MAENKSIYINSLQASEVYEHQLGKPIKNNFVGMTPFSLNSINLQKIGMKTYQDKRGKNRTNDIINLKFDTKVKSIDKILSSVKIESIENKIDELIERNNLLEKKSDKKKNKFAIEQMTNLLIYLNTRKNVSSEEISIENLRYRLYENGFKLNGEKYVLYKRTSAKSRTGQCQFIKESLRNKSIKWARLGMNLADLGIEDGVDPPSLFAYESLVDSSIIDTIKINPKNIFVVGDVISKFKTDANIVKNDENGNLISVFKKNHEMESDIFDGESILDESYFKNGKGCMLLRMHMFKSCAFNGKVQQFLRDNCPDGINFSEWKLEDLFGRKHFAKDIHLLTTPNSLKYLKFYSRKKTKKTMHEHWERKLIDDECVFGICKYEKESKRGRDNEGRILNQLSYQLINSKPYSMSDIESLAEYELDFISKMKNDNDKYIEYLSSNINDMNTNEMFCDIYGVNEGIVGLELFKNKRKKDISSYANRIGSGKVRVNSDYCVICQNPKELLYHMIGKLPIIDKNVINQKEWELKDSELIYNEFHTTLHGYDNEYAVFRNPHTSPSNVLILNNKKSSFIERYMNATPNIAYTNAIGIEINRILSGQDVDSDTILVVDNKDVLRISKKCYGNYVVCDNMVSSNKIKYKVSNSDMSKIDNSLSKSQRYIGEVVNLGQHAMSVYWEEYKINPNSKRTKELLELVDICTILSEIAIDMAKKMYDVNFPKQIRLIKNKLQSTDKPEFFKSVSKNSKIETRKYETSMDYLVEAMTLIENAKPISKKQLHCIIGNKDYKIMKKDKKQIEKITVIINDYIKEKREAYSNYRYNLKLKGDKDACSNELYAELDSLMLVCKNEISKYKITESTIFYALDLMERDHINTRETSTFLNILYQTNKDGFLNVFRKNE